MPRPWWADDPEMIFVLVPPDMDFHKMTKFAEDQVCQFVPYGCDITGSKRIFNSFKVGGILNGLIGKHKINRPKQVKALGISEARFQKHPVSPFDLADRDISHDETLGQVSNQQIDPFIKRNLFDLNDIPEQWSLNYEEETRQIAKRKFRACATSLFRQRHRKVTTEWLKEMDSLTYQWEAFNAARNCFRFGDWKPSFLPFAIIVPGPEMIDARRSKVDHTLLANNPRFKTETQIRTSLKVIEKKIEEFHRALSLGNIMAIHGSYSKPKAERIVKKLQDGLAELEQKELERRRLYRTAKLAGFKSKLKGLVSKYPDHLCVVVETGLY